MLQVLILGAGGHAQVVQDLLLRACEAGEPYQPIGFLDDDVSLEGTSCMGLPVLGAIDQLSEFDHDAVVVAIGNNHVRARISWARCFPMLSA